MSTIEHHKLELHLAKLKNIGLSVNLFSLSQFCDNTFFVASLTQRFRFVPAKLLIRELSAL